MESTGLGSRLYLFRLRKNIFKPKTQIHWPKITLTNSKISNFEQNNHKSYLRRSNTSVSSPPSSWSYPVHHLVIPFLFRFCRNFEIWFEIDGQMVKFSKIRHLSKYIICKIGDFLIPKIIVITNFIS